MIISMLLCIVLCKVRTQETNSKLFYLQATNNAEGRRHNFSWSLAANWFVMHCDVSVTSNLI